MQRDTRYLVSGGEAKSLGDIMLEMKRSVVSNAGMFIRSVAFVWFTAAARCVTF